MAVVGQDAPHTTKRRKALSGASSPLHSQDAAPAASLMRLMLGMVTQRTFRPSKKTARRVSFCAFKAVEGMSAAGRRLPLPARKGTSVNALAGPPVLTRQNIFSGPRELATGAMPGASPFTALGPRPTAQSFCPRHIPATSLVGLGVSPLGILKTAKEEFLWVVQLVFRSACGCRRTNGVHFLPGVPQPTWATLPEHPSGVGSVRLAHSHRTGSAIASHSAKPGPTCCIWPQ
jgi:hypothetical protein